MFQVSRVSLVSAVFIAWLAAAVLLASASSSEQPGASSTGEACGCVAALAQAGDVGVSTVWTYPAIEIRHLSHNYAKLDLFVDGLAGDAISAWPCVETPEAGAYTVSLSTTSESSYFDLYAFLVLVETASRTAASALFLDAETAQGNVQFSFEVPADVLPAAWILVVLFDEDLCWVLSPRECECVGYVPGRNLGTIRIVKH